MMLAAFALAFAFSASTTACGGGGGGGGTMTIAPIAPAAGEQMSTPDGGAAPAASSTSSSNAKAAGDAKVGDTAHCPVSGEEFVVTDASPHAEHNGKTYYFCCAGCAKKFSADPAKYTGAAPTKTGS